MKILYTVARKKPRIEIIPLIDIIFFLLATFVMISLSMVKNQGLNVNLPTAHSGSPQDRNDSVTITVLGAEELYLEHEKIDAAALPVRLQQLKTANPNIKVFINGDSKASFENAVKVLDEVRMAGITKVSIQTKGADAVAQ